MSGFCKSGINKMACTDNIQKIWEFSVFYAIACIATPIYQSAYTNYYLSLLVYSYSCVVIVVMQ